MEESASFQPQIFSPTPTFLVLSPNPERPFFDPYPPGVGLRPHTQAPSTDMSHGNHHPLGRVSDNWVAAREGVPGHVGRGQGDRPGAEEKVARSFE